jgi:hypothetical protein
LNNLQSTNIAYSFVGVGLGRELSFLEIFDLARFWTCNPSLGGYDPLIRGSLVQGLYMRPLRGSLHKGVTTPCKGVATKKMTWKFQKSAGIGGNRQVPRGKKISERPASVHQTPGVDRACLETPRWNFMASSESECALSTMRSMV